MINKVSLSLAILGMVLLSSNVFAQGTAQAVMQVSVRIIKGVNVQAEPVDHIIITPENQGNFDIGSLSVQGIDPGLAIIDFPKELKVISQEGEVLDLQLNTAQDGKGQLNDRLILSGSVSKSLPKAGSYKGELVARIEYL